MLVLGSAPVEADSPEASSGFDYLYIESNEGGSSGGHAAIGFDDATYHFQFAASGFLEMVRVRTPDFLTEYALLRNRGIHVSRIATSRETESALRRAFDRRYLAQRQQLRALDAARTSRQRLEALRRKEAADDAGGMRVAVPGTGFFATDASRSDAVRRLRGRIEERYGTGAITRRVAHHQSQLASMRVDDWVVDPGSVAQLGERPVEQQRVPPLARPEDHTAALEVLAILQTSAGLRRDLVRSDPHPGFALTRAELATLRRTLRSLEDRLVVLFGSDLPGWATGVAVGMARLSVLQESIDSGRLAFLDSFPEDAPALSPRGDAWQEAGPQLLARRKQWFDATKSRVFGHEAFRELTYVRLEDAANRLIELRGGVDRRQPMRLARERLTPLRSRVSSADVPTDASEESLRAAVGRARTLEDRYRRELEDLHAYHVVDHNCVSAIFETLDAGLSDLAGSADPDSVAAESVRRLGGRVSPSSSLAFIPFISSRAVRERFDVRESFVVASDRSRKLEQMRLVENDLWVHLRESNVLTSTIYERSRDDSLFLFFTEDAVATRPIYGALNLVTALGGSAAGLFALPFDRGELLLDGLRGALVSLPELVFFNIRKGSNDYLQRGLTSDESPGPRDRSGSVADAGSP